MAVNFNNAMSDEEMDFTERPPVEKRHPSDTTNILITGTPGTGKSLLCKTLKDHLPNFQFFNISEIIIEKKYYSDRDEERDTWVLGEDDEDRLLDYLEPHIAKGNCIVEYHVSELFPERFFDRVIVTHCENDMLFQRLKDRGYKEEKIKENCECEIFRVCADEALDAYNPEIVHEVPSNDMDDLENNIESILKFIQSK